MVRIAETIVRSALLRRKSRGAHTRVDFPEPSPELQKVVGRPPLPIELAEVIFERAAADHSLG